MSGSQPQESEQINPAPNGLRQSQIPPNGFVPVNQVIQGPVQVEQFSQRNKGPQVQNPQGAPTLINGIQN